MSIVLIVVAVIVVAFALLMIVPRVLMSMRAAKLKEKPAPTAYKPSAKRIKSGAPTILYFHTPTCRACAMQEPAVRAVKKKHPDAIFKIDATAHREAASAYGVLGVPYLAFIRDGKVVRAKAGVQQEAALADFLGTRRVSP